MRLRALLTMMLGVVLLLGGVWMTRSLWERRAPDAGYRHCPSSVLLIGVDGLDWQRAADLASRGRMPTLRGLMEDGASGILRSIPPFASPTIWTSIATGKAAERHGVGELRMYGDRGAGSELAGSLSIKCMTLWEILASSGMTSGVVGWLVTYPPVPVTSYTVTFRAVVGLSGGASPGRADVELASTVHPPGLFSEIADLAVVPTDIAREDVEALLATPVNVEDDGVRERTAELTRWLAADMTTVALAAELMAARPTDLTAVYIRGNDIVSHLFWRYMDPASWTRGSVRQELVDTFSSTVDAYYERVDVLLGEILDAAPEGAAIVVCSDHGFAGHRGYPGFDGDVAIGIDMHREEGIIVLCGPGIVRGKSMEGASVLDVTPTVLALLGLPVADDMDGVPLVEALESGLLEARPIGSVDSYEGGDRMAPRDAAESPVDDEIRDLLRSLGYVN